MKLDQVEVDCYAVPLPHILSDATHGDIREFGLVTVRIRARRGLEGLGYTYTVGNVGASAIESLIKQDLLPLLSDRDLSRTEAIWADMWQATHYVGRGGLASFAISAVDTALWDLKSKGYSEPLWRVLGGSSPKVRAYAGGIDLRFSLDQLVDRARANLRNGFGALKMKVGSERLRDDIERVEALRDVIGPDGPLMVDANMKWDVPEAIRAAKALAEFDVYWLEEPTDPADIDGHVRIQREGALPVAAGENLHTLAEFEAMVSAGAVAFPEPDLTNCGGVTAWMKIAHLAEAHNLPVTSHGVHDLHVSLLAAVPNASFLEVHGFGLDPYLMDPLEVSLGYASAADRPGHGVELRWDKLETHRHDSRYPTAATTSRVIGQPALFKVG